MLRLHGGKIHQILSYGTVSENNETVSNEPTLTAAAEVKIRSPMKIELLVRVPSTSKASPTKVAPTHSVP